MHLRIARALRDYVLSDLFMLVPFAGCVLLLAGLCVMVCKMMMLFIGTHSVTTTLNVHSRSRSFVIAIDLRGLAPSMRLFRRPNTNSMKK